MYRGALAVNAVHVRVETFARSASSILANLVDERFQTAADFRDELESKLHADLAI